MAGKNNSYTIQWHKPPKEIIREKTKGERGMLWLGNEFRKHMDPYVPADSLTLAQNVSVEATDTNATITYKSPYAHYQYEGVVFVDPLYGVGGFTKDGTEFWSRPGVPKKKSGRKLNHSAGRHPKAQSKWDEPVRVKELPQIIAAFMGYLGG